MSLDKDAPLPEWIDDLKWDRDEGAWVQAAWAGGAPDQEGAIGANDMSASRLFPGIRPFDRADCFFLDRDVPPCAREVGVYEIYVWDEAAFMSVSGHGHVVVDFGALPRGVELTREFRELARRALDERRHPRRPTDRASHAASAASAGSEVVPDGAMRANPRRM